MRHFYFFLLTITFLGTLFTGCVPTQKVTPKQEMALGSQQEKEILSQVKTIHSGKTYQSVKRVGMRIARASGRTDFKWTYHLVKNDETANAFVLPGGKVFVYTGLMKYAANDAELAAVMGHEVAHALRSHGVIGAQRQQKASLVGSLLQMGLDAAGVEKETTEQATKIYGYGASLGYLKPHSRKHEMQADSEGLMLMAKAGYDPRAALSFWKKFGAAGQQVPEYLSTHPSPGNRIQNLQKLMPQALSLYQKR